MPCDQINLMSVKIEAADRNLLEQALVKLGLTYTRNGQSFIIQVGPDRIEIHENEARLPQRQQELLNQIKQQYSREVVEEAALQFNWTIFEEEDEQGAVLQLRRY